MHQLKKAALIVAAGMAFSQSGFAADKTVWITLGDTAFQQLQQAIPAVRSVQNSQQSVAGFKAATHHSEAVHVVQLSETQLLKLSGIVHQKLNRCGGFIQHSSKEEAVTALYAQPKTLAALARPSYTIDNQTIVSPMVAQMQATNIAQTIIDLSNFTNRYYKTTAGTNASNWLLNKWKTMSSARSDILVEQFTHSSYPQKSVILTINGTDNAAETVVLGAHLDSINLNGTTETTLAPGADDDASGIASLTEILRTMLANNYKPRRTIKLIGYAAEEVGLLGSKDIAASFKAKNANVVGVMQLDMTNYKGSPLDIYLYTDYTDSAQNQFVANLITTYQPTLKIGYDKCGYGCSDHASWYNQGYPASMPFETAFTQDNPNIHTANDTFQNAGGNADHSLKFARLGLSFAVELASDGPAVGDKVENFSGSLTKGQSKSFGPFKLKAGGTLTASTTGTGDMDLYVRKVSVPTTTTYDCKSDGSSSTENCSVNSTTNTDVYVLVSGYAAGNYALKVSYPAQ
ncbi:M20/M25/M40 family metallo-hydrolase [Undibacterium luofuense]|uniref:M20/M25/M40 family metallo-hydrolase n=1 Tax=Undibacterium luofuense TaxID=2828733 RepID=A0A941I4M1_9BURK|nr:M20/M25/M40 family metallo-hydrolase [Undibacterium luofuense]MBR7781842.1 M20/M25/M40 family metallo-hydrolase [Undibacterium luofuense]